MSDFPAQMMTPFTTDGPEYIQINWSLHSNLIDHDPIDGRLLAETWHQSEAGRNLHQISGDSTAVEVQIQLPSGTYEEIERYCDGSDARVFN